MSKKAETAANRTEWIDLARGIGVILVILGHMNLGDGVTGFIYSFHMPLFFFLSGLVFHIRENESFRAFAVRKMKALVIPYFLLGIPLLLSEYVKAAHAGTFTAESAMGWLARFLLQQRLWTIWFLTALFLCELIMYWLVHSTGGQKAGWIRLLIAAAFSATGVAYCTHGGGHLIWNADMAMCAMLWLDAGYELKLLSRMHRLPAEEGNGRRLIAAAVAGLAIDLLCSFVSMRTSGQTLMMSYDSYGVPILTYAGAFGGICMTVMVSILLSRRGNRRLSYIGQNTWIYFAWNQTMLLPLINWILEHMGFAAGSFYSGSWWLHRLIELAFVMIISTICTIILNKIKQKMSDRN